MKIKIYYHHTDCGGVVYYARYLEFLEEARTEFLQEKGISINELAKEGVLFVVAHQEITYKSPAFYADTLHIDSRITNVTGVRLEFAHEIKNQNNQIVCLAKTIMVCVGGDFKPKAMPGEIYKKLGEFIKRRPKLTKFPKV